MWILDCSGKELEGKKRWLRPNTTYRLGRIPSTTENEAEIKADHKAISRNHLDITVGNADAETAGSVLTLSEVILKDVGSKHGSTIDGEKVEGGTVKVRGREVQFLLGNCPSVFRLRWVPMVFSFSLTTKEKKSGQLMSMRRAKVGPLDMKCIGSYVQETTHAVAKKRNTTVGLEALINGRYIVTEDFLDALVAATVIPPKRKPGKSEFDKKPVSPLEMDFEANMPDPMQYLPAPGNEPKPRNVDSFAPNFERKTLFEGQTVVFCDKAQYESLLGPITAGGGKTEFFDKTGKSAREIVNFVEKLGGSLVRWTAEENEAMPLATKVSEMLGLRLPLQNEFLDMILTCDISGLRRPLEEEDQEGPTSMFVKPQIPQKRKAGQVEVASSIPEAPTDIPSQGVLVEATMREDSAPKAKRRAGLRTTTTQSANFIDDFFTIPESFVPATQRPSRKGNTETQVASSTDIIVDSFDMTSSQAIPDSQTSVRGQKRPTPEDEDEDMGSNLAPGAERYKRLRLERQREATENGTAEEVEEEIKEESEPEEIPPLNPKNVSQRNPDTTIDIQESVMQAAREVRIEEEEERNRDRLEREKLDPDAIAGMKNLAIVEVVDIPLRKSKVPPRDQIASERWNPLWNGRANFKKFRRAVQSGNYTRRLGGRVMIEMVEERPKDFGVSQDYWDEDNQGPQPPASQRAKASQRLTASELLKRDDVVSLDSDSEYPDEDSFRLRRSPTKTATPRPGRKSQTASNRTEETPVPEPRSTTGNSHLAASRLDSPVPSSRVLRSRSTTPAPSVASSRTVTNNVRAGTKRTASNINSQETDFSTNTHTTSGTASRNTRKKIKSFLQRNDSGDDSDEGEVKFRFNRRKR